MKKSLIVQFTILFMSLAILPARAQFCYFTILAGQTNAIGTNDGTSTAALFNHPRGLAVDPSGNVYVADTYNSSIRRITPQGTVTTLTFESLSGVIANVVTTNQPWPPIVYEPFSFTAPQTLLFDTNSNLYISDNNVIYETLLSPDTNTSDPGQFLVTAFAGALDPTPPFTGQTGLQFNHPCGMAFDTNGNLYLADQYNQVVREISPAASVTTLAGMLGNPDFENGAGTNAAFDFPYGIAVGQSNIVYVSDSVAGIRQIIQSDFVTNFFWKGGYTIPRAIATDASGNVYAAVASYGTNYVLRIAPDGTNMIVLGSLPTTGPISAIALDANTNIYLADQKNSVIIKSTRYPQFFNGQASLTNGNFFLAFTNGMPFGYYDLGSFNFPIFYHYDMGFELFMDAGDGQGSAYLYDYASSTYWYTSPQLFPYLYDFSLNTWLYYFPDKNQPLHYSSNPRYFFNFAKGVVITK
ncbi:MAG TPA: hypothetical protein VG754_07535 [Verrucomicrobiae bacterium]|nr:hypothetical protein [Verrucomicrobiae bacterium]